MSSWNIMLWTLILWNTAESIKVIGGKQTAVQRQNISLSCTLTEKPANDDISQIFWKKKTRQTPIVHDFFTISPEYGPEPVDGVDFRFKFIGNLKENNGTIHLSDVRLSDEGVYTCIFTLFPSGSYRIEIPLTVLVPPVTSLKGDVPVPVVGDDWVTYASCMAAGAKPPAEVTWDTGSSGESLRAETNSTQHANGTTTTVSHLVGIPTINTNHLLIQCVVKQQSLATEDTLPFTIMVHYAPLSVNIHETSNHVFECVSDSSPKATYTWSRKNQSLPRSGISAEGGRLQFIILTSDLGGLYVCEASNPYGQKYASLYVYYDTGPCTTCWTLYIIFIVIIVAVAAGVALWFYKQKHGALPWREEARHLRHSERSPNDQHDENQREEEEEEGDRETQSYLWNVQKEEREEPLLDNMDALVSHSLHRKNQSLPRSGISAEGGRLQFIILTSDLGGLYVCEASNPYGQKYASLYVYYDTGPCTTCWTLFIFFIVIIVAVAAGVALWFYKQKHGALPWREEARHLRHSERSPNDQHDENQREEEEEEEGDRETQSYLWNVQKEEREEPLLDNMDALVSHSLHS